MSSNQNNSNEEQNPVPASEQNKLTANTSPPSLEKEQTGPPQIPPHNSQTQPPMEVHTHTHTPRQKWKHYFWEFLMLFLAVFCGFLAEYTLEHKIEKNREKQLIQSLLNDLKADTVNITALNAFRLNIHERTDSLFYVLASNSYTQHGFAIYYHASSLSRRAFFIRQTVPCSN